MGPVGHARQEHAHPLDDSVAKRQLRARFADQLRVRNAEPEGAERQPDFTYPVDFHLASPVTLAWGAEYRKEIYGSTEGDPQSYGAGPFASPQALFDQVSPGVFVPGPLRCGVILRRRRSAGDPDPTQCIIPGRSPGASGYGGTSPTYAGSWSHWSWGVYGDVEADSPSPSAWASRDAMSITTRSAVASFTS